VPGEFQRPGCKHNGSVGRLSKTKWLLLKKADHFGEVSVVYGNHLPKKNTV
jgi:hypothetical protein